MTDANPVFDSVRSMLAVRRYDAKSVAKPLVRRIVEAGRLTASSVNKQPWHFIVVEDREMLRRLGGAARTGPYIAQAALAIAVAIEKDSPYAMSDASRAIQSMMLTAWAEGLGSNWVGFGGMNEAKRLLGVPGDLDVFAIVAFGYPAARIGRGKKKRKPVSEVAHRERFGAPFE